MRQRWNWLSAGHRLVSDDVVEIKKTNNDELIGTAPDITRYFIELRGIGIIDVKTPYGVQSVEESQSISLIIKLESGIVSVNMTDWVWKNSMKKSLAIKLSAIRFQSVRGVIWLSS